MRWTWIGAMLVIMGCASRAQRAEAPPHAETAHHAEAVAGPIIYQRTGGIAGTDDRVVIWPDGLVQVRGKVLADGEGWISQEKLAELRGMLNGFSALKDEYFSEQPFPDAYVISISVGGKTVKALDLAPSLPPSFAKLFAAIEKVAGEVGGQPAPPGAP